MLIKIPRFVTMGRGGHISRELIDFYNYILHLHAVVTWKHVAISRIIIVQVQDFFVRYDFNTILVMRICVACIGDMDA